MEADPQFETSLVAAEEIRTAIRGLTKDELYRLDKAARVCLLGTEFRDSYELIDEAVARALDGRRRWPRESVPLVAFLIMTTRSIADASRKSTRRVRTQSIEELVVEEELSVASPWPTAFASPEETRIESEHEAERHSNAVMDMEKIDRHFENDHGVRLLITYLENDRTADEICAELRWSDTEYATVRRRLRRGLAKLFPGGRKP